MKKLQKGDVVRIKSIEWYNKFNQNGIILVILEEILLTKVCPNIVDN